MHLPKGAAIISAALGEPPCSRTISGGVVARTYDGLSLPYPQIWSSDDLELGAAKFGHFVQNVGADLGFGFLVGKAACFQFGTFMLTNPSGSTAGGTGIFASLTVH